MNNIERYQIHTTRLSFLETDHHNFFCQDLNYFFREIIQTSRFVRKYNCFFIIMLNFYTSLSEFIFMKKFTYSKQKLALENISRTLVEGETTWVYLVPSISIDIYLPYLSIFSIYLLPFNASILKKNRQSLIFGAIACIHYLLS